MQLRITFEENEMTHKTGYYPTYAMALSQLEKVGGTCRVVSLRNGRGDIKGWAIEVTA